MDKQPLLSHPNRPPPPLLSLPEDGEVSIPISPPTPLTPSQLKEHLIFGTSSSSSSPPPPRQASTPNLVVDALTLSPSYSYYSSSPSTPPDNNFASSTPEHLESCFKKSSKAYLHRSKTAPAMAVINELNRHRPSPPESPNRSHSVIRQAMLLLSIYLFLGVIIYWFNRDNFRAIETHPIVDAVYFCIVTMCTIGYGDITPDSNATKVFSMLFVLVGFGFIDILLSGMVGYVLDLQESYMLNAVKHRIEEKKTGSGGVGGGGAGTYIIDVKKGRMRIRIKVGLALGVVVLCIFVGAVVMHCLERLGWLDSFYLSVMSVTTVGYGDKTFNSMVGRVFASVWLLVSTLAVARAFLYLAEARVDKRQRRMAKWVLGHDMTVAEFLAADIDNNGFVSKSEYVIYKLKEMGKVSEKDILQICNKFDKLDTGNYGKISLADLMRSCP